MTHRNVAALIAVGLAPGLITAVGHALRLNGRVVTVLACVAWVGCVAACVRIWIGWRAR